MAQGIDRRGGHRPTLNGGAQSAALKSCRGEGQSHPGDDRQDKAHGLVHLRQLLT